jgi:hypothetical protein
MDSKHDAIVHINVALSLLCFLNDLSPNFVQEYVFGGDTG